jgi:Domain of unknown function (DUF4281)
MLDQLFGLGNIAAIAGWALLILLPRWRGVAQSVAGIAIPALLSLAYAVLIGVWWSRAEGGFGSIEAVRALFGSAPVLVAGWFHYLAFDLFVGAWISRDAQREGISHAFVLPLLVLTFLVGPIGYLGYLGLRTAWRAGTIRAADGPSLSARISRLWHGFAAREPVLVATGLGFLLVMIPTGIAYAVDDRTLGGANVWLKPLKFEFSLALFAFTLAWFMPLVSDAFRRSFLGRYAVWAFVALTPLEMAYIAWRASLAEASHFNNATPATTIGYALMGIAAVLFTLSAPALAVGIARRDAKPIEPAYRLAVILGLVLTFLLGGIEGIVMSTGGGHNVGIPLAGDAGMPIFGWLRTAGDLRVAHFLGIHAQQAIPIFGAIAVALFAARARPAVVAFAVLYALIVGATAVQALLGQPLLPL